MDINNFPSAGTVIAMKPEELDLFEFEWELEGIQRNILWAARRGKNSVQYYGMTDMTKKFLIEKGYKVSVDEEGDYAIIRWGKIKI